MNQKATKSKRGSDGIALFLCYAAQLPDKWVEYKGDLAAYRKSTTKGLIAACHEIMHAVRSAPYYYDNIFFPTPEDPIHAKSSKERIQSLRWMLSVISNAAEASLIPFPFEDDPDPLNAIPFEDHPDPLFPIPFGGDPGPAPPRKVNSRTACEVFVIQQLSHQAYQLFGGALHGVVAAVVTVLLRKKEEEDIDPERVRELSKATRTKKAG